MRLLGFWPEIGDGEAGVEVGAEVVHPADGEGDVHAELGGKSVSESAIRGG